MPGLYVRHEHKVLKIFFPRKYIVLPELILKIPFFLRGILFNIDAVLLKWVPKYKAKLEKTDLLE